MKNRNRNNFLFISILILLLNSKIHAGSLSGTSGLAYTTFHNVFRSSQSATGVVRMANGFTVATPASGVGSTHGSIAYLDTCLSVSGGIDLRTTNTMFLRADLTLDNGVTFSPNGGTISGYDRALILNGNLSIPNNSTFHIGGRIIIDGNGNTITMGNSSKFLIDANATLTLKNLIIKNTRNQPGNPFLQCSTLGSKLCLNNVFLDLADDFYFNCGQLFIHNDVSITGTSALIYSSPKPLVIDSDSSLYFDTNTTFSIAPATFTDCPFSSVPTTTTNNFIFMQDKTSQIYLNNCTLCTTLTGCRFTKGSLIFDNNVNIKTNAANDIYATTPLTFAAANVNVGGDVSTTEWSPNGRSILVESYTSSKFYIFDFNGTNSLTDLSSGGISFAQSVYGGWSPDSKSVVVPSTSTDNIAIYSMLSGAPILVTSKSTTYLDPYCAEWSPDGRYIAVCSSGSGGGIEIFAFNGVSLISIATLATSLALYDLNWSPDGKYIATVSTTGALRVYSFTPPSTITLVGSVTTGTSNTYFVNWSPDGRFIAVANNTTGGTVQIFAFNGIGNPISVGSASPGDNPNAVIWLPDGKYFAVSRNAASNNILIYSFSGFGNPSLVGSISAPTTLRNLNCSPDGKFISAGGYNKDHLYVYKINYINTKATQSSSNSFILGNSALGAAYDLNVRALAGANIEYDGIVNYDCVN